MHRSRCDSHRRVTSNIKHHLGLKGRNLESLPRTEVGQVKSSQSALRENSPITNAEEGTITIINDYKLST